MVITLSYYPLVYLPVVASLRGLDPALEESAWSLGHSRWRSFRSVVLPQLRPALLGGTLLVGLHLLAEFGALQLLRFPTFTTAIYDLYGSTFNGAAANMIAGVLVFCCLLLLLAELRLRGRRHFARVGQGAARAAVPVRLGARGAGARRAERTGGALGRRPDVRAAALAPGGDVDGVPARRAGGRCRHHDRAGRLRRGRDHALRAARRLARGPPPQRGVHGDRAQHLRRQRVARHRGRPGVRDGQPAPGAGDLPDLTPARRGVRRPLPAPRGGLGPRRAGAGPGHARRRGAQPRHRRRSRPPVG